MRIAQLTLNGYFNYGNVFQKYALQHTLKKFSDSVEVLWYDTNNFSPEQGERGTPLQPVPSNVNSNFFLAYDSARMMKIKEFCERYITTRFNLPYIEEIADEYDFFIVGSDQVWNPYWLPPYLKFLLFVPREKKIAYAASIANPEIPERYKEFYRQGIKSFAHVSVREEGAVKLIEELGLNPPLHVIDPVMLLTIDDWQQIWKRPSWFKEKYSNGYILTYYLRNAPPSEVKAVATKLNLPVINLLNINNFSHHTVGPEEFIYLFAHATLIFANSFHGIAFSILFRRPFINLEYDDESARNMSLRIPSLLKMCHLEDRRAIVGKYHIKSPLEIDFSTRDKVLPQERVKAFKFLTNALSSNSDKPKSGGGGL